MLIMMKGFLLLNVNNTVSPYSESRILACRFCANYVPTRGGGGGRRPVSVRDIGLETPLDLDD
jgi:hypothetical protein